MVHAFTGRDLGRQAQIATLKRLGKLSRSCRITFGRAGWKRSLASGEVKKVKRVIKSYKVTREVNLGTRAEGRKRHFNRGLLGYNIGKAIAP